MNGVRSNSEANSPSVPSGSSSKSGDPKRTTSESSQDWIPGNPASDTSYSRRIDGKAMLTVVMLMTTRNTTVVETDSANQARRLMVSSVTRRASVTR